MIESLAVQWLAGLILGVIASWLYFLLLQGQMNRTWDLAAGVARSRLMRGLPLRLLLWAPFTVLALRMGWGACAAFVMVVTLGRWPMLGAFLARQRGLDGNSERGR